MASKRQSNKIESKLTPRQTSVSLTARSRLTSRSTRASVDYDQNADDADDFNQAEFVHSHVDNRTKNSQFEASVWQRETCLRSKKLEKSLVIAHYPTGLSEHGELTFLAKTRIKFSNSKLITEQIGQVRKSILKLEIVNNGQPYEVDSFVVLYFERAATYYWSGHRVVRNLLRLGFDTSTESIIYAGRSCTNKNYHLIGRLTNEDNLTVITSKQQVQTTNQYEYLCVKPSPASLKHLARVKIRSIAGLLSHLNEELFIETGLQNYLKYKNNLKCGREMRRGDRIVSQNGKYSLSLDADGRLRYHFDQRGNYLFLYENVESIWFYELSLVVCFGLFNAKSFLFAPASECLNRLNVTSLKNFRLKLTNSGLLVLKSKYCELKCVCQLRDDIKSYWNTTQPKFDYACYLVKNKSSDADSDNDCSTSETDTSASESSDDDDDDCADENDNKNQ